MYHIYIVVLNYCRIVSTNITHKHPTSLNERPEIRGRTLVVAANRTPLWQRILDNFQALPNPTTKATVLTVANLLVCWQYPGNGFSRIFLFTSRLAVLQDENTVLLESLGCGTVSWPYQQINLQEHRLWPRPANSTYRQWSIALSPRDV